MWVIRWSSALHSCRSFMSIRSEPRLYGGMAIKKWVRDHHRERESLPLWTPQVSEPQMHHTAYRPMKQRSCSRCEFPISNQQNPNGGAAALPPPERFVPVVLTSPCRRLREASAHATHVPAPPRRPFRCVRLRFPIYSPLNMAAPLTTCGHVLSLFAAPPSPPPLPRSRRKVLTVRRHPSGLSAAAPGRLARTTWDSAHFPALIIRACSAGTVPAARASASTSSILSVGAVEPSSSSRSPL